MNSDLEKTVGQNPFGAFRNECETILRKALVEMGQEYQHLPFALQIPPNVSLGQLASSVCFELAKKLRLSPAEVARRIVNTCDCSKAFLVDRVEVGGEGYVNFHLNYEAATPLVIESALSLNRKYGQVHAHRSERVVVEHTSVNPIHAIHIGQARNPVLGDAIARMLKARGHQVSRHYYVDDTGRQSAVIAYGYDRLGRPRTEMKPDHFIGQIYAVTSCLVEIRNLKKKIEQLKQLLSREEEWKNAQRSLDEWTAIASELQQKYTHLFHELLASTEKDPDPQSSVNELTQLYEKGDPNAKKTIREVSQLCIEGFKQTLRRMEVDFDQWDWESDLIWSGRVGEVVNRLRKTAYVHELEGALELDSDTIVRQLQLRGLLGIGENYEMPSLTLVRSDGTTLYTTRDIAYSLQKFEQAQRVVNVIGSEQTLAQLQLKTALCALGYREFASAQKHFTFGLVELPGYKMSSRRGRFITLDEVMDEATERAFREVEKRSPELPEDEKLKIAEAVAIGAIKYALVSIEPERTVIFTWDRVLNFEMNSAPFINYAYTRALGILRKVGSPPEAAAYSMLQHPLERELILLIGRFPEILAEAADNLRPDDIANHANQLAEKFHEYYEKVDISHLEDVYLKSARARLVMSIQVVLRNATEVLGIRLTERM